jgi:hypothetical protein
MVDSGDSNRERDGLRASADLLRRTVEVVRGK